MRSLSASDLLNVWERGWSETPTRRAMELLAATSPAEELAPRNLSIGQRDAHLLQLREWTFGSEVVGVIVCPGCGTQLESTYSVSELRVNQYNDSVADQAAGFANENAKTVALAGYEVHFRLPNSFDLLAVATCDEVALKRQRLLERCVLAAKRDGSEIPVDQVPEEVMTAVVEHMAEVDPQADIQLAMTCPLCNHQWQIAFDIVTFFWHEIEVWARRTLSEVHRLAAAYGWSESEILALSAWRRQTYLEMLGGL